MPRALHKTMDGIVHSRCHAGRTARQLETGMQHKMPTIPSVEGDPMAGMIILTIVTVGTKQYELMAHQKSKSEWVARGGFNGVPLEGKGRSATLAAASWREQARLKNS